MTPTRPGRLTPLLALLCAWLAAPAQADGQTRLSLSVTESLERLEHEGPAAESQHAPAVTATVEHFALDERLRLFYALDAGTFATEGDWTYLSHGIGVSHRVDLGSAARRLFIGGQASVRLNGDAWTDANYRALSAFANLEWRPAPTAAVRTGYRLTERSFPDLDALDQREHSAFGSAIVNLPTRTTLIGEVTVGLKAYESVVDVVIDGVQAGNPTRVGRGPGLGPSSGGPLLRPAPAHVLTSVRSDRAQLVQVFGRVAQSLADRLSVSTDVTLRRAFGGAPPTLVATPEVLFDDAVYDDPYASDGWIVRAGAKRVFDNGAALEGGVWRVTKDYTAAVALGADGLPLTTLDLRRDRAWRASVEWSLPVASDRTGPFALAWWMGYRFTDSGSNDVFYTYTSHRLGTGLTLRY